MTTWCGIREMSLTATGSDQDREPLDAGRMVIGLAGVAFFEGVSGEVLVSPNDACGFALTFTLLDNHIS